MSIVRVAVLPARHAEHAASEAYAGAALARQQQNAYPDIAPTLLAAVPAMAASPPSRVSER